MLTHRITLPDGTKVEFFASDEATFQQQFGHFEPFAKMQSLNDFQHEQPKRKHRANKAVKQARKRQKQARRKHR